MSGLIDSYANVYSVVHDGVSTPSSTYTAVLKEDYTLTVNRGATRPYSSECDLFVDDRGNLFLGLSTLVKTYTYTLNYGGVDYSINNQSYGDVLRHLDRPIDSLTGTFTFTGSKPVVNRSSGRCDASLRGPAVFTRPGEQAVSDVFNSTFVMSMGDIDNFEAVLSVDGVGHMIYVQYVDPAKEDFDVNENNLPKTARTLFELLRLMVEWRVVGQSPWNNDSDEIVAAVTNFFAATKVTQAVIDDALANQCDMQVARYLKGNQNARQRPDIQDISPISAVAQRWLLTNVFHESAGKIYERCFQLT